MLDSTLKKQFKKRASQIAKAKQEPRFVQVLGKLKRAGLLDVPGVPEYGGPVDLKDVLWAGEFEPRVLELLPGLVFLKPKFFRIYEMPQDLKVVLKELESGTPSTAFRNIPPELYTKWVKEKKSKLKTFRLSHEDIALIQLLRNKLHLPSDTEVIRRGLQALKQD